MSSRCAVVSGLIAVLLCTAPVPLWAADPVSTVAARTRFERDTIYHVRLDLADSTAAVFYGPIPLVKCAVHATDPGEVAGFARSWAEHDTAGWRGVMKRQIWAGRGAVSDTVIGVIAKVSSVDPELIRRVLPDRFEIILSDNLCLRVMTPVGAAGHRPFVEKWQTWTAEWNPFHRRRTLDLIVSPQDAQTLYYAFEPGAPVLLTSDLRPRLR